MYIVVYRGINHNIDELLVGTYTQINLRQQIKIRQQLTADKEYSKDKVIQSEWYKNSIEAINILPYILDRKLSRKYFQTFEKREKIV